MYVYEISLQFTLLNSSSLISFCFADKSQSRVKKMYAQGQIERGGNEGPPLIY